MQIYVGNLSYETVERDLREMFEKHGEVLKANVVSDRDTGQSRGFGFIDMPVKAEAEAAIAALNGTELNGRALSVNEARPRTEGGGGGGRGSRPSGNRSDSGGTHRRYGKW